MLKWKFVIQKGVCDIMNDTMPICQVWGILGELEKESRVKVERSIYIQTDILSDMDI